MMDEDKDHTRGAELVAQMQETLNLVFDEISFEMGFNGEKYEPVSYTHLDVYKRQPATGRSTAMMSITSAKTAAGTTGWILKILQNSTFPFSMWPVPIVEQPCRARYIRRRRAWWPPAPGSAGSRRRRR